MSTSSLPERPNAFVLGSGSWGTGIASILVHNCASVTAYGKDLEAMEAINTTHTNPHYLPGVDLPPELKATDSIEGASEADVIAFVVPSSVTAVVAADLAKVTLKPGVILVSCAKGIELGTGRRMSQIIGETLPDHPLAVLSGPNHAEEVSRKLASCAVIASEDQGVALALQKLFTTPYFRFYTGDDMAGLELGGAIKNVYAIAAGCAKGLGLGDNAIAALVTRGLAELTRLGVALGGRPETFMGLSGVGDLMVTCYSEHSRNHRFGLALGKGVSIKEAEESLGMVAEGVPNTKSIHEAARRVGVRTPLLDAVYGILYENREARALLHELLTRAPRGEQE
jgi:glycerol-3-phosphate dehydrogenase (NAD(P)+)